MTTTPHPISPLRQRMLDDMRMRKFGDKTQLDYMRAVRNFAKYLGCVFRANVTADFAESVTGVSGDRDRDFALIVTD